MRLTKPCEMCERPNELMTDHILCARCAEMDRIRAERRARTRCNHCQGDGYILVRESEHARSTRKCENCNGSGCID